MVRPDRDRLSGWIEVDETYIGGLQEGTKGRQKANKALVVIAAQADGPGIGRIRMRMIPDASAENLHPFIVDCSEPGSTLHSDGWHGYSGLEKKGFEREVTIVGRRGYKLNCVNGHRKDQTKETRWLSTSNSSTSCWR